jgi:hypothetical protein
MKGRFAWAAKVSLADRWAIRLQRRGLLAHKKHGPS